MTFFIHVQFISLSFYAHVPHIARDVLKCIVMAHRPADFDSVQIRKPGEDWFEDQILAT